MEKLKLTRAEALRAAIRRLPENHPSKSFLKKELHNTEAGVRGENRLRKKFVEYYSTDKYEIIWNVNLSLGDWPVQIDGLLLTSRVAVVIESKNISGDLYFDNETGEFYRIDSTGVKTVMDNPAIQVEKHVRFMKAWLNKYSIHLPVEGLLVFTAKQSELKSIPRNVHTCRVHQMIEKLFNIMKVYQNSSYSENFLKNFRQLIDENQTPYAQKSVSLYYSIEQTEFSKGIYCNECNLPTVERQRQKWYCKQCGLKNENALYEAVREYFALIGGHVTNKSIRGFTGFDDRHIVKRLLTSYAFQTKGKTKDRQYFIK